MNLLAIIDHSIFGDRYLEIAAKCAPFADMIWYRIKGIDGNEVTKRAYALRNLLKNSTLILSERADIAAICCFNGVHLNASNLPPKVIKQIFPKLIVGFSAHQENECFDKFCDYFTLSPIFATPKPYPVNTLGAVQAPGPNVFALGGITKDKIEDIRKLGYLGVAGISLCTENLASFNLKSR